MNDYELIFRHRGDSYHRAMVEFPGVRRQEFENLFARFPLQEGESIIDCPALGGYLADNVSAFVKVDSLDYCPQGDTVKVVSDYKPEKKVDRIVCLASSHHLNNLENFLSQLSHHLKKGGYLHLADVDYDSPIRYFLDDFVGQWTSTGHSGIWRSLRDFSGPGILRLQTTETRKCPWFFHNRTEMIRFCRLLFGLDLRPTDSQVVEALERYVGVEYNGDTCKVLWELTYVDFVKHV